jgi:DNA-binding CsgD family transcriptional regulator
VDRLYISTSPSASGLALSASGASATRIAFVLEDRALAGAMRRALLVHPGLEEADPASAAVIVTDRPAAGFTAPLLTIGSDRRPGPGESAIRSLDPEQVLAAASLIAAGHRIEPSANNDAEPVNARLSQRERQVAALLVEGASNKLIARVLGISVHTAKFHVAAVLEKLGARNRADAVAIALREGFVAV